MPPYFGQLGSEGFWSTPSPTFPTSDSTFPGLHFPSGIYVHTPANSSTRPLSPNLLLLVVPVNYVPSLCSSRRLTVRTRTRKGLSCLVLPRTSLVSVHPRTLGSVPGRSYGPRYTNYDTSYVYVSIGSRVSRVPAPLPDRRGRFRPDPLHPARRTGKESKSTRRRRVLVFFLVLPETRGQGDLVHLRRGGC